MEKSRWWWPNRWPPPFHRGHRTQVTLLEWWPTIGEPPPLGIDGGKISTFNTSYPIIQPQEGGVAHAKELVIREVNVELG
ncbi:hypothetical protein CRG98_012808 [Punica granatum]|uniref:Uncharacterized protein n=1 Tax=Punica granatum TaxID=22663 RepID=A0A2I0KE62_PUNGR|nr:hypothetical protein CRG98_012808 [Punica granatum]